MKNDRKIRKILAVGLCFSIGIGSFGCKKKTTGKQTEVKASDPYFETEVHELSVPVDETKKIQDKMYSSVEFVGSQIMLTYDLSYVLPKEADPFQLTEDYYLRGTGVFDLSGNLISNKAESFFDSRLPCCYTQDSEGNLVGLISAYDMQTEETMCSITFSDSSGKLLKTVVPQIPESLGWVSFSKITVLPEGKMILGAYERGGSLNYVFDEQGNYLFELNSMDRVPISSVFTSGGKNYVLTSGTNPEAVIQLNEVNMNNGAIQKGRDIKTSISNYDSLAVGEDGIYVTSENGICKLNVSTCEMEEILNWNQTDLNQVLVSKIRCYPINDDEIYAVAQEYDSTALNSTAYVIHIQRAETNPHAGKKILTVGGMGIPMSFYSYAHEYNTDPSHKARITTIDYMGRIDYSDAQSSLNSFIDKLRLDLLSGNGPDILLNISTYSEFASEDLFVDLNTYIDGEEGIDRSGYFDNILRAAEKDGKLYSAPISFMFYGYVVNTEMLDVRRDWTLDEFEKAADSLPDISSLMPETSKRDMLHYFMGIDYSRYIDNGKKETHFLCDDMKKVLPAADKYGSDKTEFLAYMDSRWEMVGEGYYGIDCFDPNMAPDGVEARFHDGGVAMYCTQISSAEEYAYLSGLAGGSARFVGYPSINGEGIAAYCTFSMSIVSSSSYREEAWDIIRGFYSEEAQMTIATNNYGGFQPSAFPMKRSVFESVGKETVEHVNSAHETWLKDSADPEKEIDCIYFPAKEGLYEELLETVESIHVTACIDGAISDIISEEAAAYFAGSRTEDEVLKTIDNRARQVIQER
ncbi:MAG: extracellular solute-binding protein [Clostridiales bacterium]|nr:extracellular solute-binding protein [Clostridiales bacterium]